MNMPINTQKKADKRETVTMSQKKAHLLPILQQQPVMPVLLIERRQDAVPLAQALVRGGIRSLEVTLRTEAALDCITSIAQQVPEAIVGAGTVLDAAQFAAAEKAGAQFVVSPGLTPQLVEKAAGSAVPLLPGAVTPGEIMAAREQGYDILKFFPAEQAGGVDYVKALASPLAGVTFCPTGGINLANAPHWLSLPNVICVGGSWLAPQKLIQAGRWDDICALAAGAAQLNKP